MATDYNAAPHNGAIANRTSHAEARYIENIIQTAGERAAKPQRTE
jgi:hypothetical protein